ncbi:MAG: alkaline phosphatase family protein [Gammaproteobacteria bacterium]|nr:alkaline phosphatase family protein [Gammaproteobacteria bacterium]
MNILFITADQWRGECLSLLGHPHVKTPNLDALAAEGVLFKNHYAQAVPCAPSRSSLHTGMYMQNHRCVINGAPLDDRFSNWAREVANAGYAPSLFGYTDSAVDPRGLEEDDPRLFHFSEPLPGIGTYTAMRDEVAEEWVEYLQQKGYQIPDRPWSLYADTEAGVDWADGGDKVLPLAIKAEDHETHYMVDRCIDWIGDQQEPWITHLSLLRPHPPFAAPEPYNEHHDPAKMQPSIRRDSARQEAEQHPLLDYFINHSRYRAPDSERQTQQDKANYFGLIDEVDDNLGRLFDSLRANGQWDKTLIIFTSDHGDQLGDHWLMSKLGYFDQSYHIPLIIRDPRSEADASRGRQIHDFSEGIDVMPTMLDWLGLEIPSQCDGFSLLSAVRNGKMPLGWRKEAHWECDFRDVRDDQVEKHLNLTSHQCGLSVIRDHHYKYVHFATLPPLFFDLQEDPGEFVNQAGNPDYRSLVLEYAQKMLSWKINHADRGLTETMLGEGGSYTRRAPLRKLTPLVR